MLRPLHAMQMGPQCAAASPPSLSAMDQQMQVQFILMRLITCTTSGLDVEKNLCDTDHEDIIKPGRCIIIKKKNNKKKTRWLITMDLKPWIMNTKLGHTAHLLHGRCLQNTFSGGHKGLKRADQFTTGIDNLRSYHSFRHVWQVWRMRQKGFWPVQDQANPRTHSCVCKDQCAWPCHPCRPPVFCYSGRLKENLICQKTTKEKTEQKPPQEHILSPGRKANFSEWPVANPEACVCVCVRKGQELQSSPFNKFMSPAFVCRSAKSVS